MGELSLAGNLPQLEINPAQCSPIFLRNNVN